MNVFFVCFCEEQLLSDTGLRDLETGKQSDERSNAQNKGTSLGSLLACYHVHPSVELYIRGATLAQHT